MRRLAIVIKSSDRLNSPDNYLERDLFEIFKLNDIGNNLTHLILEGKLNINSNIFENINNFKFLKYLEMTDINFDKVFILNLNSLNYLRIHNCQNISLSQECANNLKYLAFTNNIN